jgi:hypothetical protein
MMRPPPRGKATLIKVCALIVFVAFFGHAIADIAMMFAAWIIGFAVAGAIGMMLFRRFWR